MIGNPVAKQGRLPTLVQCIETFSRENLQIVDYECRWPDKEGKYCYPDVTVLCSDGSLWNYDKLHGGGILFERLS